MEKAKTKDTKKKKNYKIKNRWLHRAIWLARPFVKLYLRVKYGYKTEKLKKIDGNYIIMSNHTMELDPVLCAVISPHQIYFVCGEHLMTKPIWKTLNLVFNPIPKYKGDVDVGAIMEVMRRIRAGYNILLYPEGSRSFSGKTEPLEKAVGSLVKACKCNLITYKMQGGYFCEPRWAYTVRKGDIKGHIQGIYTKEELAKLSDQDVTDIINHDLYENAYARQRENPTPYKGKRLAEGLENYLVLCPCCGKIDSIKTEDDKFCCEYCGMKGKYNEYGFLEGESLAYDSVYDWGQWEEKAFKEMMLAQTPDSALLTDEDITMQEIAQDHTRVELTHGCLKCYQDRFEINGQTINFRNITGMSMLYYGKTLVFTSQKRHFNLTGEKYHAIKYQWVYDLYKQKKFEKKQLK